MILVVGLLVVAASVPLWGGRWSRLSSLRLAAPGLLAGAVALQVVVLNLQAMLPGAVTALLSLVGYGLLGTFLIRNRSTVGLPILGLGWVANVAVSALNGGVTPAAPGALAMAGFDPSVDSAVLADARLAFLGDVFAVPQAWPLSNVYSVGDLLMILGAAVVLHHACDTVLARAARNLTARARDERPDAATPIVSLADESALVETIVVFAAADGHIEAESPEDTGDQATPIVDEGQPVEPVPAVADDSADGDDGWWISELFGTAAPVDSIEATPSEEVWSVDVLLVSTDVDRARSFGTALAERGWSVDRAAGTDDVVFAIGELPPPRLILVDAGAAPVVPVGTVLTGAWSQVEVAAVADVAEAVAETLHAVGPARELTAA